MDLSYIIEQKTESWNANKHTDETNLFKITLIGL